MSRLQLGRHRLLMLVRLGHQLHKPDARLYKAYTQEPVAPELAEE